MRITLAISSMGCGGAERVMATLANRWAGEEGQSVTLLTLSAAADDFYQLDPNVARIGLQLLKPSHGAAHAFLANARRVAAVRRAIESSAPDVVVSFMDTMNVLTLCATAGLGVPVVVSERIDPTACTPGRFWSLLRRATYGRASGIVIQTTRAAEWARRQGWSVPVTVIANPVDARFLVPLNGDARAETVVGIGRLTAQKRFDRLIDGFDRVATKHPGWSLVIAGEGPLRGELADRMSRSAAASRMRLCGRVEDVVSLLRGSRIFVLSSAFEGFPNALHEAMACGCAVIATDCPSGPSEMVANGLTGLLVPQSVDSISDALDELMGDESRCRTLGSNAHCAAGTCSTEAIGARWDALIDSLLCVAGASAVRAHA
jgi:GalNAc-alpha-(1->4)-GalNAc-alpha-(1->3)-diNAcBac-PP-undecaprenol alpha-1,4-N-acetyl-D-galactosaminyltransferase